MKKFWTRFNGSLYFKKIKNAYSMTIFFFGIASMVSNNFQHFKSVLIITTLVCLVGCLFVAFMIIKDLNKELDNK